MPAKAELQKLQKLLQSKQLHIIFVFWVYKWLENYDGNMI